MGRSEVREPSDVAAAGREILPALMLVLFGIWLLAQLLFGGITDRIFAWVDHFGGNVNTTPATTTPAAGVTTVPGLVTPGNGGGGNFTPGGGDGGGGGGGGSSGAS